MKKHALAVVMTATLVFTIPEAFGFQQGERVTVGSINQTGTVLEDTGKLVKVRLDSSKGYSEGVGVWYDKEEHKVTSGANSAIVHAGSDAKSGASAPGSSNAIGTNSSSPGGRITVGNKSGTILEDTGKLVKVHFDDSGYSADVGVWIEKEKLSAPGGTSGATVSPVYRPTSGSPASTPGSFGSILKREVGGAPTNAGNQVNPAQRNQAYENEKGISAGSPPDGVYQCNKISGRSYIHIGTIEIRGGTYKGFSSQQGSFHPFTTDASGGIVWTGGLTGLPDGWKLLPAKYVGLDYKNHPLIRVYYNSARGAAEVVDAVKER